MAKHILHPEYDHPWHVEWDFTFIKEGFENRGEIDEIDKRDLETVSPRQIMIKKNSVKAYALKSAIGVHVNMKLPHRIEQIIIIQDDCVMCYATNNGQNVYSGTGTEKITHFVLKCLQSINTSNKILITKTIGTFFSIAKVCRGGG